MDVQPEITVSILFAPWVDWRQEQAAANCDRLAVSDAIASVEMQPASTEHENIWRDVKQCWEWGAEQDGTHHLVLQGDVALCEEFGVTLRRALRAVPNRELTLYAGWQSVRHAWEQGHRWVRFDGCYWGQARCLPTADIPGLLSFNERYVDASYEHDDTRYQLWNQLAMRRDTWVPVPQLVEHLGADDSAKGNNTPADLTAAVFVGDTDETPADIDWNAGLDTVPRLSSDRAFPRVQDRLDCERLAADGYIKRADQ